MQEHIIERIQELLRVPHDHAEVFLNIIIGSLVVGGILLVITAGLGIHWMSRRGKICHDECLHRNLTKPLYYDGPWKINRCLDCGEEIRNPQQGSM